MLGLQETSIHRLRQRRLRVKEFSLDATNYDRVGDPRVAPNLF